MMDKILIIAEAGVNHNADITIAKRMIEVAYDCGADVVKFQTAVPELVMTINAPKADYQKNTTESFESQLDMAKKLHLPLETYKELKEYADRVGIKFLSTAFDFNSLKVLTELNMEYIKIPSGEITNLPYLRKIGGLKKKIILSTGMSDLGEIEDALEILVSAGTSKENITVLQCNTEYPTPYEDVNLLAMITIRNAFGVAIGYSDHTLGIEVPIAAVALGARVIEKHFTLNRNMEGPDHKASLEPDELKQMVIAIRNVEMAMGSGIKRPSLSEKKNIIVARKSIVAARDIHTGEVFTEENIAVKRPGNGISPIMWDIIVGKKATKNFKEDEFIII
jgi:N,N'-diacetyllegionaminate synthase